MRTAILTILLVFVALANVRAQLSSEQMARVRDANFETHQFDARHPDVLWIGNNAFTRYNPVSLTLSGMMYLYQKAISPQLQSDCPYEVSCSAFSKVAIGEFGLVKGVAMTADRLTRCTEFTKIDILPSQVNMRTGRIIDPLEKYHHANHRH